MHREHRITVACATVLMTVGVTGSAWGKNPSTGFGSSDRQPQAPVASDAATHKSVGRAGDSPQDQAPEVSLGFNAMEAQVEVPESCSALEVRVWNPSAVELRIQLSFSVTGQEPHPAHVQTLAPGAEPAPIAFAVETSRRGAQWISLFAATGPTVQPVSVCWAVSCTSDPASEEPATLVEKACLLPQDDDDPRRPDPLVPWPPVRIDNGGVPDDPIMPPFWTRAYMRMLPTSPDGPPFDFTSFDPAQGTGDVPTRRPVESIVPVGTNGLPSVQEIVPLDPAVPSVGSGDLPSVHEYVPVKPAVPSVDGTSFPNKRP